MAPVVSYTFSFDDYKVLLRAVQSRQRFGRWTMHVLLIALIFLAAIAGLALGIWRTGRWPSPAVLVTNLGTTLLITAVMLSLYEIVMRLPVLQRHAYHRLSVADRPIHYALDETGVSWSREGMSGRFDWSTVQWIATSPDALVLLIGRQEGTVLPRRGAPTPSDFEAMATFVGTHVPAGTPTMTL